MSTMIAYGIYSVIVFASGLFTGYCLTRQAITGKPFIKLRKKGQEPVEAVREFGDWKV